MMADGKGDKDKQIRVAFHRVIRGVSVLLLLTLASFVVFVLLFAFFTSLIAPFFSSLPRAPEPVVYRQSERDDGNLKGKIAFMFLTRGPLPLAPLWEKFFKVRDNDRH